MEIYLLINPIEKNIINYSTNPKKIEESLIPLKKNLIIKINNDNETKIIKDIKKEYNSGLSSFLKRKKDYEKEDILMNISKAYLEHLKKKFPTRNKKENYKHLDMKLNKMFKNFNEEKEIINRIIQKIYKKEIANSLKGIKKR